MNLPYVKLPLMPSLTCYLCGVTNDKVYVHRPTPRGSTQAFIDDHPVCGACFRTQAETEGRRLHEPIKDINAWVNAQLASIGMSKTEREADPTKIPPAVLKAYPPEIITSLLSGALLSTQGIGLGGIPGAGKSCSHAALVRGCVYQNARNKTPFTEVPPVRNIRWMAWNDTCHRWRMNAIDWTVERDITVARKAKLLILDDLGRETRRKEAGEDVATGHLDNIITHRDREGLLTLWTTNLTEDELVSRYGLGMIRRLLRLNPLVYVEDANFHPDAL